MPHFIYQRSGWTGRLSAVIVMDYRFTAYFNQGSGQPRPDVARLVQAIEITEEEARLPIRELEAKYPFTGVLPEKPPPKPPEPPGVISS